MAGVATRSVETGPSNPTNLQEIVRKEESLPAQQEQKVMDTRTALRLIGIDQDDPRYLGVIPAID